MSFEPDTNDIRVRQLGEEIKKIREEQFAKAFPVGLGGGSSPVGGDAVTGGSSTGTFAWLPNMVRVTRDTGVVERLAYENKSPAKDFFIGDTVTGDTSGASGEVGDIDITGTDTGFLIFVPGTTSGTFVNGEDLDATTDGNNVAEANTLFGTPVGRGHLNAGSASIIAEATSSPAEIHFIDTAQQNGQFALLRAQNGQTIRMRRAVTDDGNTGNLDLDESFDITENALVLFQFQRQSNVTPDGGWVPLITEVTSAVSGGGSGGTTFPILYPQTNIGVVGSQTVALDLNNSNGHYQLMTLDGDIALAFVNETSVGEGFKFYTLLQQDAVGGHSLVSVPTSVKNGSALLTQVDETALAQTLIQFTTADGGTTYHAQVVSPTGSGGQNQTPWLSDIDASTFDLFNADKIRFFGAGGFSFPTDATIQGISTSGTGLQFNVPSFQTYRYFIFGEEVLQIGDSNTGLHDFFFFDNDLKDVSSVSFTDSPSFQGLIFSIPSLAELQYFVSGVGSHHSFFANNISNASFEIREFVNKSNVNFDMVTNNILNIDQALFDGSGGFQSLTDHAERRITGGASGIAMNIPKISPFAGGFNIWFENDAQDDSDLIYRFEKNRLVMPTCATIEASLGYLLCNGGGLTDIATRVILNTGQVPGPLTPQLLELSVSNQKKVEFTNLEDGTGGVGGGMKMFTDINMQTQNINNVDVLDFEVDSGVDAGGAGNGTNNIVAFDTSTLLHGARPTFLFNIPPSLPSSQLAFSKFHQIFATFDTFTMHMHATGDTDQPFIVADGGFSYGASHLPAFPPVIDGQSKLINNSGSFDVVYRTGGNLVNLSDLTGAGGGLDIDNDLGTVGSQAVEIDWDVSNFHRMIVDGDITVGMNNLPDSGEWQEIEVQFTQDGTGGHQVNFIDVFTNGVTPRISKGANRITTVRFYSYNDGFERILAFNIVGQFEIDPFFQGILLASMANDQQSNTSITNHLEFDTNLFTDKITVSSSGGQASGVFSGFVGGRTYECTCHFAVENVAGSSAPASMTIQWFDRATSTFLGVPGTATDIIIPENHQPTAVAYFTPTNDGDTLEVQIISNNGSADGVLAGDGLTTSINIPASKVTIKDCGISEGEFNNQFDEDVPPSQIPPPPPPIAFSVRGFHYNSYVFADVNPANQQVNGALVVPIDGESEFRNPTTSDFESVTSTGKSMAGTAGFWRSTTWKLTQNTVTKDMVVTIMEDDEPLSVLFTIPAFATGTFTSASAPPVVHGRKYWYRYQSIDQGGVGGRITASIATEIRWGFAD